jgi:lysophospholipid acyltransferase (LPLAT)-like uncharacterized protein
VSEARVRWIVRAGAAIIRLLGATWRVREVNGAAYRTALANDQRVIYAFWHGELLALLWHHRREPVAVMISEHRDGEIIARICERLGYATVRGSSSRGASRALIGLVRAIESGLNGAVSPDGPRGPAHVFAPGAAIAAQRTGVPIVPVRVRASRAWRLRSWDRFLIPKPFARVDIYYGEPTPVRADTPRAAAEQAPALGALLAGLSGDGA